MLLKSRRDVVVLAFVWEKIRPVIIIKTDKGSKIYVGVSHSKKRKNMKKLTQECIEGISVDEDTVYGLANTPGKIIKEVGTISIDKAQEILDNIDKKKIIKIENGQNLIEKFDNVNHRSFNPMVNFQLQKHISSGNISLHLI